jgi:hypothetical protein
MSFTVLMHGLFDGFPGWFRQKMPIEGSWQMGLVAKMQKEWP